MKKTIMEKICTGCLTVLLVVIIVMGVKRAWMYYTGPMNTVDKYMNAIDNANYEEVYSLLDKSTLNSKWDKEFVISYYQNYYGVSLDEERVQAEGWRSPNCYLISSNIGGEIETLELITKKVSGNWKIIFPFSTYNLEINAPFGSIVYVDDERIGYVENTGYICNGLLKGEYQVKVQVDNEELGGYEDKIKLCSDKMIDMPYDTGNIEVKALDCMNVRIKNKYSENEYTQNSLNNILVGDYIIKCYHPYNYILEIDKSINIVEGDNSVEVNGYTLSDEGKRKYKEFIDEYYQDYAKGIEQKNDEPLYDYFESLNRDDELKEFREWYIDNKDITSSTVSYNSDSFSLNDRGYINANIIETVELVNKEKDKEEHYKVVIEWELDVNINDEDWKISNRVIKQSIVAVKDANNEWIEI